MEPVLPRFPTRSPRGDTQLFFEDLRGALAGPRGAVHRRHARVVAGDQDAAGAARLIDPETAATGSVADAHDRDRARPALHHGIDEVGAQATDEALRLAQDLLDDRVVG